MSDRGRCKSFEQILGALGDLIQLCGLIGLPAHWVVQLGLALSWNHWYVEQHFLGTVGLIRVHNCLMPRYL